MTTHNSSSLSADPVRLERSARFLDDADRGVESGSRSGRTPADLNARRLDAKLLDEIAGVLSYPRLAELLTADEIHDLLEERLGTWYARRIAYVRKSRRWLAFHRVAVEESSSSTTSLRLPIADGSVIREGRNV